MPILPLPIERRTPPEPPPRRRTNDPPNYERIYEEVNVSEHHGSSSDESSASDSYIAPNEGSVNEVHVYDYARDRSYENYGYTDLNQMRRDVQYNHHYRRLTSDGMYIYYIINNNNNFAYLKISQQSVSSVKNHQAYILFDLKI